jgi:hypothetical protein
VGHGVCLKEEEEEEVPGIEHQLSGSYPVTDSFSWAHSKEKIYIQQIREVNILQISEENVLKLGNA